jgi:hypothetical protein
MKFVGKKQQQIRNEQGRQKTERTPATPGMPAADARPERIQKQVSEETSTEALATAENRRPKQRKLRKLQP